jgi:hypothetical protein
LDGASEGLADGSAEGPADHDDTVVVVVVVVVVGLVGVCSLRVPRDMGGSGGIVLVFNISDGLSCPDSCSSSDFNDARRIAP